MEHKTWLWRRKASEKTAHGNDKYGLSLKGNQEEAVKAEEIERSLKSLNEKLTSALTESTAKDELLAKHIKVAEEALEGWEKAEAEAASLKEELDDALQCKFTAEEKIADIETALEECKQQLQVGHEEQKQMASDAAMKTLREKEKIRKFEERLVELNKCLSKLGSENSNLIKDLEIKEKLIEDLSERNNQAYAKINAVTENLESLERDNASLKYEVCMLEKELQIRNEEREFNLKSVDAAHKQHLESVRKIAKLESECQRLRVMVRKRLPGPAALAKMRREVELLGKDTYEMKKKKPNSTTGLLVREFVVENYSDSSHRRDSLVEQLNATEEENRILKETLTKKNSELQSARVMCAHTASKLSHAEKKLEEISKGHANFGGTKNSPASYDMPVVSACENGANEDNISCAESWASALISELENFRNVKTLTISPKSSVVSELNLMDDFIDMEKLAIVCVDKPLVNSSSLSGIKSTCLSPCDTTSKHDDSPEAINNSNVEIQSGSRSFEKSSRWLQDVVSAILQRYHVSKRSLDSILEEVRVTLASKGYSIGIHPCGVLHANGEHLRKTQHSSPNLLDAEYGANLFLGETATSQSKSMFDKSVKKLIKLIEEINKKLLTHDSILQAASKNDESTIPRRRLTYAGYISCVFHWKTTELTSNLQCLIQTCNDVLSQKTKGEIFFEHLISTMERIINHCFSLQGVSSMKDTFKKLDWYESHELAVGGNCQCQGRMFTLLEGKHTTETLSLSVTDNSGEEMGSNLHGESRSLSNDTMKLDHLKEMKVGQKSVSENDSLIEQLVESEKNILNLKAELATLKESKRIIEAQIEHQRLLNEELDTQLSAAKVELNGVHQKFSSLEEALGDKTNCCEELEATCLELQLQLESASIKESSKCTVNQDQKQLRTNWEISAASEKLAECQETILNLGRQLKALASPSDATLFDEVISKPKEAKANQHRALLDQMLAEDDEKLEFRSPNRKETVSVPQRPVADTPNNPNAGLLYGRKILPNHAVDSSLQGGLHASPVKSSRRFYSSGEASKSKKETDVGALAIVPKRHKTNVSLLRKLLSRRKKDGQKLTLHAATS